MKTLLPSSSKKAALLLGAGDLAMLLLFTAIGGREHSMQLTFSGTFGIALPFLLAWTAIGWLAGAFRPPAYASFARSAKVLAAVWIAALPAGLLLRLAMYGKPVFTVFAVLALFFIYVFLLVWRLLFTGLWRRTQAKPSNRKSL